MSVLNFELYNTINSGFGTQYAYKAVCWKRTAGFLILAPQEVQNERYVVNVLQAINSGFGTQYAYKAVCWKHTAGFLIWHRKRCKMSGT